MNFYIIYPSELGPYMQKDKIVLVDIRNRQEYMKSHWPGAINMEEKEIKNIESFLRKMPQKLVAVFYCTHGGTSMRLARQLAKKGYMVGTEIGGYEKMKEIQKNYFKNL